MAIPYIQTEDELQSALRALSKTSELAVDLEFDRNYHRYGFNLCLIQIFDGNDCYLFDPLSRSLDIRQIFPVLENPQIRKVVFAFGEDLRLLHSIGCFPKNIFDLDIATSLLNYPPSSLNNLLEDVLEIDTGKSSQRSNWFRRPLSDQQIRYASQDVLHLFELQDVLMKQALKKNITQWIEEENRQWDHHDYSETEAHSYLKEKDKKQFSEQEWHIFTRLMAYREKLSQKVNRPGFQVIPKPKVRTIVKEPAHLDGWTRMKGIHRKLKTAEVRDTLKQIYKRARTEARKRGLSETDPAKKPPSPSEMNRIRERKNKIRTYRSRLFDPVKQKIEEDYGKEAAIFMFSNRVIAEIVDNQNGNLEQYKANLLMDYAEELDLDQQLLQNVLD